MSTRKRRILFIDRDGTLIVESPDDQNDSLENLQLIPHVIPALLRLRDAGYEFVIINNQYREVLHDSMLDLFASQGISFCTEHIRTSAEQSHDKSSGIGTVINYLKSGKLDLADSWVIGDRDTDLQLAEDMGIGGLKLDQDMLDWPAIAHKLVTRPRTSRIERRTRETGIVVHVDLDSEGTSISTGIGFFNHMLDQLASHGGFRLDLHCEGDLHIDEHHTVEDCALALGEALNMALGNRRGIGRYGFVLPMDEALATVAVDLSGRPVLRFEAEFPCTNVGQFSTEMVQHFFASLSQALGAALHLNVTGDNTHHMIEGLFKGCGRALRPALARGAGGVPSTKGLL